MGIKKSKSTDESLAVLSAAAYYRNQTRRAQVFSLYLVSLTAVALLGAVVFAVLVSVFGGMAIALSTVLLYFCVRNEGFYSLLGVHAKSDGYGMRITGVSARKREELYLPARMLWMDVTVLETGSFSKKGNENLRILHLPKTLTEIQGDAFRHAESLEEICFEGSESEFLAITKTAILPNCRVSFFVPYPKKQIPLTPEIPEEGDAPDFSHFDESSSPQAESPLTSQTSSEKEF